MKVRFRRIRCGLALRERGMELACQLSSCPVTLSVGWFLTWLTGSLLAGFLAALLIRYAFVSHDVVKLGLSKNPPTPGVDNSQAVACFLVRFSHILVRLDPLVRPVL